MKAFIYYFLGFCGLVFAIICGIHLGNEFSKPYLIKKQALEAAESGYTIYLNGHEVEYTHVDLNLYSRFSVDDDHRVVYIVG